MGEKTVDRLGCSCDGLKTVHHSHSISLGVLFSLSIPKLGEGNYGTVYRGRDLQTGEFVAMKLMRPRHSPGQDGEDALSASTIREISSKNVAHFTLLP